ncbi:hypothetical protein H5410_039541 [Solanum commersonii]|uniref:Myricetin 7/4'-O-methyltransferase 2 n=1 Tax=Solanum commersonii TaxID=4109 RepID=A0A9J5XL81_SOLCO|nr:hypothetical protein H5410_039541 [Solanum commersonii]
MSTSENNSELLQAQTQIWNHIFSFMSSSALRCAVQLDIPDILYKHDKPMHLSDLSTELSLIIDPSKISFLPNLMQFLVHSGILEQHDHDYYSLTPSSCFLVKDKPFNLRSLVLLTHDPSIQKAWFELGNWYKNDFPTAFHTANGNPYWDYFSKEPKLGDIFNDVMASESGLIVNMLITECRHIFEGLTSLVDVGGGTGTVAIAIAKAFPSINCIVLDLPHVIEDLKSNGNMEFVGGDMFEKIPNANAILLKWILHNWNDEDCVKILKKCKESIPSRDKGGKLIIIDVVLEDPKNNTDYVRAQYNMDMMMVVCFAAKERTKKEWEKLFNEAGFNECKITSIPGSKSIIQVYP